MSCSIRVLLVEDTLIAQIIAKNHFSKQGCEVDVAEDGHVALEMASQNQYDLILMDVGLGDGPDGFEVTSSIKNTCLLNKNTPVIAITAHGESSYKEKALDVGIEQYFNKPLTPDDVKKIIDYIKTKGEF